MSNFEGPIAHDIVSLGAESTRRDARFTGGAYHELRLTVTSDDGRSTDITLYSPGAVADKFARVAAAINAIFADEKKDEAR